MNESLNRLMNESPFIGDVRGYGTMVGYWDEKKKTEEVYTHDRFFRTGFGFLCYIIFTN